MSGAASSGEHAPTPGTAADKDFLVVGLGGSAGAIASFREFFRNVPPDSGLAYVVILHLSPEHESRLAEVLQSTSRIPVNQVRDHMKLEPNQVYVIPPNKSMAVDDGTLVLSDVRTFEQRRAPVDIFFRTLADQHKSRAVCVVMSGSGSDGSMGLRRVKENDGLVLVQDPSEAAFGEMPRTSIATGLVDFVVPAAEMPARILAFRDQLRSIHTEIPPESGSSDDADALVRIFAHLRARTGHDFSNYKRATVLRRIARRIAVRELSSPGEYATFIGTHQEEAYALLAELLISVTNFFRDAPVWQTVEHSLLPKLVQMMRPNEPLRVWVPGCATGEEAYSIAMLLAENERVREVQIFATDLDEEAIARARSGTYTAAAVADISSERLRRFFLEEPEGYRVRREIREMVLFAHHNLLKDPPFSHIDFVSCRNVLIYLNRTAQQRAMDVLHFALNPGGYLLLGNAESVDTAGNLFSVVDKDAHLYQSRIVARASLPQITIEPSISHATARTEPHAKYTTPGERFASIDLHHQLLEEYAPPSIVVNEDYDIVHLSNRAARFLQFTGGEASLNLLQVIRQELRTEVRSALLQAAHKRIPTLVSAVVTHTGDEAETIDMIVKPVLREGEPPRGYYLVLFDKRHVAQEQPVALATPGEPAARQLEEELMRVKTQMRATIEQYEIHTEEAKAANEELQAMNEELRSTAEELETSQEELQSVNEELQTVNQELKVKIEEVTHANDDMRNLMSSTDIGTIFVDRSLRVKLFTARAGRIFSLIAADVGRSLLDISNRMLDADLAPSLARVLERLQPVEREVETSDGEWYLMRMLPYRTSEDRIDGAVLTFVDITERRRAETALRESEEQLRKAIEIETVGVIFFESGGRITYANEAFLKLTGYSRLDLERGLVTRADLTAPESSGADREAARHFEEFGRTIPHEKQFVRKDQTKCWALFAATRISETQGVEFIIDITARKRSDEALRTSELQREREELLRHTVELQEEERQRIARELHDEMGQHVTALRLGLEALPGADGHVSRMKDIANEMDQSIERLTLALRPPALEERGLDGAVTMLAEQFSASSGVHVDVHCESNHATRLPDRIERTIYRVLQEGLTNVIKHARARNVSVIIEQKPETLTMIIEDDGRGFTPESDDALRSEHKFGLIGMRERLALVDGTLHVESTRDRGTTLYIRIPAPSPAVAG